MKMLSFCGIDDISQLCRVCLDQPDEDNCLDLDLIYDEEEQMNYYDCFALCTNIHMNDEIDFPKKLCKSCGVELQMVYDFHKKVKNGTKTIKQWRKELIAPIKINNDAEYDKESVLEINGEAILQIEALEEVKVDSSAAPLNEIDYNFNDGFEVLYDDIAIEDEDKSSNDEEEHINFEIYHPTDLPINEDVETLPTIGSDDKTDSAFLLNLNDDFNNSIELKSDFETFEKILVEDNDLDHLIDNSTPSENESSDYWLNEELNLKEATDTTELKGKVTRTIRKRHVGKSICEYCQKEFKNRSRMLIHRKCHEANRLKYSCDECGRVYVTKQAMQAHIKTVHSKTGYTCPVCQKIYPIRKCLEVHMRFHTGDFPFECDICKKRFAQFCHLKTHNNVKHNNVRFGCQYPDCGKYFTSSASLRNHEFAHSIMPFECSFCQRGYPAKAKLRGHIKRAHKKDLTLDQLESMRKFQVLRSKLNLVQIVHNEQ